jgi:hypothetical protein
MIGSKLPAVTTFTFSIASTSTCGSSNKNALTGFIGEGIFLRNQFS